MSEEVSTEAVVSQVAAVTAVQKIISGQLRGQTRQLLTKIAHKLSSLSRLSKLSLCFGAGLLLWWWVRRPEKPKFKKPLPVSTRKKRVRQTSTSTFNLTSEASSVVSRPSYNWSELQKASVSDQESVVSGATLVDGTQLAPQQLGLMGMEALETVISYWEDALAAYNPSANNLMLTTSEEAEFIKSLEDLLEAAFELQDTSEMLFIHQNSILNKRELALKAKTEILQDRESHKGELSKRKSVLSISSLEDVSFVSAQDTVADLRDFDDLTELDTEKLALYQTALDLYESSGIEYRVMRTEFVGCATDVEYLAKLHCLRSAFCQIMGDNSNRDWWINNGRIILTQLLVKADKDPKDFLLSFDDVLEFLSEKGVESQIMEELSSRNVKCVNFYDICLDYILIDSFEDLESPPSSVNAVMKNRWLSNSFKESALQTAIWSVFQAKRRLLHFPNGFKARFYNVSEILTPTLAWAFFGPDEELNAMVNEFKEQVLGFLKDIFSFHSADFKSVDTLSKSVMSLAKARLDTIKRKLDCNMGAGDT